MKLYCRAPVPDETFKDGGAVCNAYLGQAPDIPRLVLIAVTRSRTPRKPDLEPHKDVRNCKRCGWWNVYIRDGLA